MGSRRGGVLFLKKDGEIFDAKGNFTYNLGAPKRDGIVGPDRVHGYKEVPQIPFIEGEITDSSTVNLSAFLNTTDSTLTLELANGKTFVLRNSWYAGEGNVQTEEGNVQVRFEGLSAEEVS